MKSLKEKVLKNKPSVVFLMETRAKESSKEFFRRRRFNFSDACYVNPIGLSGGLALWWQADINLEILFKSENLIHVAVKGGLLDFHGFISFIYGPPVGQQFTWSNGHCGSGHVKERLDRALCNLICRNTFVNAQVIHLDFVGSDHCAIVLHLDFRDSRSRRSFKFEAFWLDHPGFMDLIKKSWYPLDGFSDAMPVPVLANLKRCSRELDLWSSKTFLNNKKLIDKLVREFQKCKEGLLTVEKALRADEILKELKEVWEREEKYWWQRSRIKWLDFGDKNTKFFHSSTIMRRNFNKVLRLKGDNDVWLDEEPVIAAKVKSYFDDIFASSGPRDFEDVLSFVSPSISDLDNFELCKPVSAQEIKDAAFQLGGSKAPGPDGFSSMFYHHSWAEVGVQITKMVQDFFETGGIKLARYCPTLTHCFFADDSLFFFEASHENCSSMKAILDLYCNASGQLANLDKSCLFFSPNTPLNVRRDLSDCLGIGDVENPGNYLGLPVVWGSILEGRDLLLAGVCWRVGNGADISVWCDPWIPGRPSFKPLPVPIEGVPLDWSVRDLIHNGRWRDDLLATFFAEEDRRVILKIPVSVTDRKDKLCWTGCKNGCYSVKSGYKLAIDSNVGLVVNAASPSSVVNKNFWKGLCLSGRFNEIGFSSFQLWLDSLMEGNDSLEEEGLALVAFLCWYIWKGRCLFVFQRKSLDPIATKSLAESAWAEFLSRRKDKCSPPALGLPGDDQLYWQPPAPSFVKVNTDGAFSVGDGKAGIGVVFRNVSGGVLDGCAALVDANSAFMSEALAVRKALEMAVSLGFCNLMVESDCLNLIRSLNGDTSCGLWDCSAILDDILSLKASLGNVSFGWIPRSYNLVADWLSKAVVWRMCPLGWVSSPPSSLALLLAADLAVVRTGVG
ncbi:reverse transcriptase [Senna tora]|uniref:Reverse transcriptase n=1 Tax=Senna tora TaxID=362788 RepID=A0A834WAP8_9FABA|nr:reverse transcriptase [Senna tora]